jgi:hypothetical protein
MNTTRWFGKTTDPYHWGTYEISRNGGIVEKANFNDGRWEVDVPFVKWRGINCSLKKGEIRKLENFCHHAGKIKSSRSMREATAALQLARHYFSIVIPNTSTGKSKTYKVLACSFYRMASNFVSLTPVDVRAFERALNDLSFKARKRYMREIEPYAHRLNVNVPDEL